ncbi:hypothetical protein D7X88_17195 [bacterium C-53]|nr:hypothetical protein [Lachnospiraceae bacterium]NBI04690.1 hypothetical protein [Lachnospiraceae bacterium]RKJ07912.1 hypothetical protein D7X88_17195 [bacterium C-53]
MRKATISALSMIVGAALGAGATGNVSNKKVKKTKDMSEKHLQMFFMMNQWVRLNQAGKSLVSYFEYNNYKKIAIYGMSYAGETLLNELKDTDITVAYGIDKNADSLRSEIKLYTMEDELDPIDAVVVTAITFFDEVEEKLLEKVECPVISLEDILYEV